MEATLEQLDILTDKMNTPIFRVSPEILFRLSSYDGLSYDERWGKAIRDGWRFDMNLNKFYK